MHIIAPISVLIVFSIAVIFIIAAVTSGSRNSRRHGSMAAWLSAVCLALVVLYLFASYQSPRPEDRVELVRHTTASAEPLDAAWERFNRPRIPVEAETKADSQEQNKRSKAKNAAAEESDDKEVAKHAADQESPDAPPKIDNRPAWVVKPPKLVGDVRSRVVKAGPYETVAECQRDLQELGLPTAVQDHLRQLLRHETGVSNLDVPSLGKLGIGMDYVLGELARDEYVESVDSSASFEPMKTVHVLLEFRKANDNRLLAAWREYNRRQMLWPVVGIATLVVGGLGLVYGLLKVDTWTRGYYTKRLLLGVPAAILGAYGLLVFYMETLGGR